MSLSKIKFDVEDKKHILYNTWFNMLSRCYVPFAPGYESYGGRGLYVCERWLTFKNFTSDMGERPFGMTLDRVDNDGGYSPQNCKWANKAQQMVNRRTFGNNKTGATGVVKVGKRYESRFDYENVRYRLGYYDTLEAAKNARLQFIEQFNIDRELAVSNINKNTIWTTNTTGTRGISKHKSGGYVARVTDADGTRVYLGYYKTLEDATNARQEYYKK